MAPRTTYPEIDRLRGCAILATMLAHLYNFVPPIVAAKLGSPGGVDLFLVVSGFLITRSLLAGLPAFPAGLDLAGRLEQALPALKAFFVRRFCRLMPIGALGLALPILLAIACKGLSLSYALKAAASVITGVQNYLLGTGVPHEAYSVFWSLAVEVHFYLLLPIVFLVFPTKSKRLYASMAIVLGTWFLIRPLDVVPATQTLSYWYLNCTTHRKLDGPFLGVLLALVNYARPMAEGVLRPTLAIRFIAVPFLIFVGLFMHRLAMGVPGGGLFAHHSAGITVLVSFGILLQWASLGRGLVGNWPLIGPALEWIGVRCYSLYLLHLPVFIFTSDVIHRLGLPKWVRTTPLGWTISSVAGISLAIGFAAMTYRWIEVPYIARGKRKATSSSDQTPVSAHPSTENSVSAAMGFPSPRLPA